MTVYVAMVVGVSLKRTIRVRGLGAVISGSGGCECDAPFVASEVASAVVVLMSMVSRDTEKTTSPHLLLRRSKSQGTIP